MLDDLPKRQDIEKVRVPDDAAAHTNHPAAAIDALVLSRDAFLKRGRRGDELERRAGLIDIRDRAVSPMSFGIVAVTIGVEARKRRDSENLTRLRAHHDRDTALRVALTDGLLELRFRDVLQVLVDREKGRAARPRLGIDAARRAPVARVRPDDAASRLTADFVFERIFDAAHPCIVEADISENVRGQAALRIVAPALVEKADARQVELTNAANHTWLRLALEPHEAPVTRKARGDSRCRKRETGREL